MSFDRLIDELCEEYYNEDTFIPNGIWDSAKHNLKYEEMVKNFLNEILGNLWYSLWIWRPLFNKINSNFIK